MLFGFWKRFGLISPFDLKLAHSDESPWERALVPAFKNHVKASSAFWVHVGDKAQDKGIGKALDAGQVPHTTKSLCNFSLCAFFSP